MIRELFGKRKTNVDFLRKSANMVGKEIERWPYEKLIQPAELISFSREIEDVTVYFSLEVYEENKSGDVHVCIDVDADIPTFPYFRLPSYVFWKRKDESVYY